MKPELLIKRAYEKPEKKDGYRVLVDRLWPRGIKKEEAAIDDWQKELAPSTELRTWFGHDPELWTEFQKRYIAELKKNELVDEFVAANADRKKITLVYGAKDTEHSHALVLQRFLAEKF